MTADADKRRGPADKIAEETPMVPGKAGTPDFAHESEREFARLLDGYDVEWEYEPQEFPIEWDKDGVVIGAFKPDFYLPDTDQYIETTVMSQKLITKKRRKVRLLNRHHPEIRCTLLDRNDYHHFVMVYGLQKPDGIDFPSAPKRQPGEPIVINASTRKQVYPKPEPEA